VAATDGIVPTARQPGRRFVAFTWVSRSQAEWAAVRTARPGACAGGSKLLGSSLPAFGLTVQASQTTSDVNVLSMPHILTADNKEAEIAVGQRVPFQLGVESVAAGDGARQRETRALPT
jgi:type II secretory pathway component GspD/PulD (secretin)